MTTTSEQFRVEDFGLILPRELVYAYARGNMDLLSKVKTAISVVGCRASTGYGEHVTMDLVTNLTGEGKTIASTSDYGIGGMALRASLASGVPPIVFLAGGTDRLYPAGHDTLLNRILDEGGLLVSMASDGQAPTKERMENRHEFMALSTGAIVVTEAGWRSGSLKTARAAFEAGTPVYGVPGPITSATSAGVHELIRENVAHLVTQASDIRFLRMS